MHGKSRCIICTCVRRTSVHIRASADYEPYLKADKNAHYQSTCCQTIVVCCMDGSADAEKYLHERFIVTCKIQGRNALDEETRFQVK